MTAPDLAALTERVRELAALQPDGGWPRVLAILESRPATRGAGAMAAWFAARHGARVDTVQVKPSGGLWAPGPRTVDASNPSRVVLDGSSTLYARHTTVASDDASLVVTTATWDGQLTTIYREVSR